MREAGRLLSASAFATAEELRESYRDRESEYPADWRTALGVAMALALTAAIAAAGVPAWWVTPLAVAVLLLFSIRHALRLR